MSDNTNQPKALVIPDAEQIQRDAELFGTTRQWIEYAGAVATGQQEGTQDEIVSALAVVHENIVALEQRNFIGSAAIAGLKEAADLLTEQRDQAITEKVELEAAFDEAIELAREEAYEMGIEEAAYNDMYWADDELDLDEAWQAIKEEMESYVEMLGFKLKLLGQAEAAKELHAKVQTAIRAYDDADSTIIKYNNYCGEHMEEIAAKRRELQQAAAEKAAAEHPTEDEDDDSDEDDEAF